MKALRRNCINIEERTIAINYNNSLAQEGGMSAMMQKVPAPIFRDEEYSFHLRNAQSYYTEKTNDKDIIIHLAYDGIVRIKYDPLLEQQLELFFSLG